MMRPRTSSALAIVRQKVSPAPQPASTHCSHYSAMICGPACLPRRLVDAISANILQCAAHCLSPSCKPSNVNIWTAYRSESTAYARHPACPYDARLAQLNASTRAGFDAGAFSAPHPSDDHFDIDCSLPGVGRANPKSRQEHDPAVSAGRWLRTRDPSTACAVESTGIDAGGKHFALWVKGETALAARPVHSSKKSMRCETGSPCSSKGIARISDAIGSTNSRTQVRASNAPVHPVGYTHPLLRSSRLERRCNELSHEQPWMATQCDSQHVSTSYARWASVTQRAQRERAKRPIEVTRCPVC